MPVDTQAEKKRTTCTKERWCKTMNDRIAIMANSHVKGLVQFNLLEGGGKDMEIKKRGVVYKTKPSDDGVLLHWCPFCGENLYVLFEITRLKEG